MLTKTWYKLLLLLSVLTLAYSCRCVSESTQSKFCNRDFGAVVRIIREVGSPGTSGIYRRYLIGIRQFYYRKGGRFPILIRHFLVTGIHSAACGVNFQPRAYYAVSGRYRRRGYVKYLQTFSCDYWTKIPRRSLNTFDPPFC